MKNKIFRIISLTFILLFVSACGDKTKLTASDFATYMNNQGLEIVNLSNQYNSYEHIKNVVIAKNIKDGYQIEFCVAKDEENAKLLYSQNVKSIKKSVSGSSGQTEIQENNYSKFTSTSTDYYSVVYRVDNTLIYINAPDTYQESVKSILKGLDY